MGTMGHRRVGGLLAGVGVVALSLGVAHPPASARAGASACDDGVGRHTNTEYANYATDIHTAKLCVDLSSVVCIDPGPRSFSATWTVSATTDEADEITTLSGPPFNGVRLPGPSGSASKTTTHTGDHASVNAAFNWYDGDSDGAYAEVRLAVSVDNPCEPPATTTTTEAATSTIATTTTAQGVTTTTQFTTTTTDATTTTDRVPNTLAPDTSTPRPTGVPNTAPPETDPKPTVTSVRGTTPATVKSTLPATGSPDKSQLSIAGLISLGLGVVMLGLSRRRLSTDC